MNNYENNRNTEELQIEHICKDIYCFHITLPRSPLKYLNCYVVKGESGRSLLIDTGYDMPESKRDLFEGIEKLGLTPDNTDVFLTHIHADHTGNARLLSELGYRIIMSAVDYDGVLKSHTPDFYGAYRKSVDAGVPQSVLEDMFERNPTPIMLPETFPAQTVEPGAMLSYGSHEFTCLETYGHSPGHISLYDAEDGIIILGDHVLFDITPNIVIWTKAEDALAQYMNNLRMVKQLPIKLALPAHRTCSDKTLQSRVDELLAHHAQRLDEIEQIINARPGLNAYETAGLMHWSIRARNWEDFPATQKYFAVCECMAHLQHMVCLGRITEYLGGDGIARYRVDK